MINGQVLIIGGTKDAQGLALSRSNLLLLQRSLQVGAGILMSAQQVWQQQPTASFLILFASRQHPPGSRLRRKSSAHFPAERWQKQKVLSKIPGGSFYDRLTASGLGPESVDLLQGVEQMATLPRDEHSFMASFAGWPYRLL